MIRMITLMASVLIAATTFALFLASLGDLTMEWRGQRIDMYQGTVEVHYDYSTSEPAKFRGVIDSFPDFRIKRLIPGVRYNHSVFLSVDNEAGLLRRMCLGTVWVSAYFVLLVAVLFATYPVIAFIRGPLRRVRRRRRGRCVACGYDLTGLPEPRCPECERPFRNNHAGDAQ